MNSSSKNVLSANTVQIIDGDLLEVPTGTGKYIVQQCCCICTRPAGLSAAIAAK
jgi:hypothetical protein